MKWIKRVIKWLGFRFVESKHGKHWSKDDFFLMKNMTYAGEKDSKIAQKLGRTKRAVQQKRYNEMP